MAAPRLCSIDGCGKIHYGRNWCHAHYERWRLHGDPLVAKPIGHSNGVLLKWLEDHKSYKDDKCLTWPFHKGEGGRAGTVGKKDIPATRVMCELVHGPAPSSKHQAAHNCGKGHLACVNPNHLEWKLPPENERDKIIHGTSNRGSRNNLSKLTEKQVLEIRSGKIPAKVLAKKFGVTKWTIFDIRSRRTWAWLQ